MEPEAGARRGAKRRVERDYEFQYDAALEGEAHGRPGRGLGGQGAPTCGGWLRLAARA